jgi:hypothetical protein
MRKILFCLILSFSGASCVNTPHTGDEDIEVLLEADVEGDVVVEVSLTTGYLSAGGHFTPQAPTVFVTESGWSYIQVQALLDYSEEVDPTFLRVVYTSDRIEWVGTKGVTTAVFLAEEECLEAGYHCDDVVPGEGISGYFDAGAGEIMSITNTHCTGNMLPYSYTVSAYAIDISYPLAEIVSDKSDILILCESKKETD